MVIYADILFVVNFFITYLLLLLTSLLLKRGAKTIRLLIASSLGGLYSLVIFIDGLNFLISAAGKIFVSFIIVLIAFGFIRLWQYIKTILIFYFSNMVLLGIVTAFLLIFKPSGIALSNGIVYFDISAKTLIISSAVAYAIAYGVVRIYNRSISKKEIYKVTIFKNDKSYKLFAFADSGNKLREPFSDYPVIIADSCEISEQAERIIPYNTVGGEGMLKAFKPDKVIISGSRESCETDKAYVAMSTVDSREFSAIINPDLLNI